MEIYFHTATFAMFGHVVYHPPVLFNKSPVPYAEHSMLAEVAQYLWR